MTVDIYPTTNLRLNNLDDIMSFYFKYRQTSNINHTLLGNKMVHHSDIIGASPVGAAPTKSSFST